MIYLLAFYLWTRVGLLAAWINSRELMILAVDGMRRNVTKLDSVSVKPEYQKLWGAVNGLQTMLDRRELE